METINMGYLILKGAYMLRCGSETQTLVLEVEIGI